MYDMTLPYAPASRRACPGLSRRCRPTWIARNELLPTKLDISAQLQRLSFHASRSLHNVWPPGALPPARSPTRWRQPI